MQKNNIKENKHVLHESEYDAYFSLQQAYREMSECAP